ncbi:hypothetical protein G6F56_000641 [Rhizopus delemar]|uniref:Cyclin N-terminal domain-containing protein n=1 Tax=Rhizopus stolonifer TaxID=4846 RepID=A0A367KUC5_RHIST|nr:hypothetical protein G6F56_000641 [Rhizopus delemar]RCI05710.1 hypothetical protein CU098_010685 [Rhizopus stolonifer]
MESSNSPIDEKTKRFIELDPTNHFLQHLAEHVSVLAPYIYHPSASTRNFVPPLASFITLLARRSRAKSGTLLSSLIIMEKLKKRLDKTRSPALQGSMLHTVFLCCMILTTKYLHDASPKNSRWSRYAAYFSTEEINKLERRILMAMDHHLKITKEDFDAALNSYYCTMHSISPTLCDNQFLPKAASVSSFHRSVITKQSHISSILNHVKTSFSELRKLPNNATKSKAIVDDKSANSSKPFDLNTASNSGIHTPEEENTKGLVHSQSLLDTTIPSGDLFVNLCEHISSASLTSNSTSENDSLNTLLAENDKNEESNNTKTNKKGFVLSTSPTNFSDILLNDEWLKKFNEKS